MEFRRHALPRQDRHHDQSEGADIADLAQHIALRIALGDAAKGGNIGPGRKGLQPDKDQQQEDGEADAGQIWAEEGAVRGPGRCGIQRETLIRHE